MGIDVPLRRAHWAAHVEGEAMRSELIWLAYRVAVDQGAPLPEHGEGSVLVSAPLSAWAR